MFFDRKPKYSYEDTHELIRSSFNGKKIKRALLELDMYNKIVVIGQCLMYKNLELLRFMIKGLGVTPKDLKVPVFYNPRHTILVTIMSYALSYGVEAIENLLKVGMDPTDVYISATPLERQLSYSFITDETRDYMRSKLNL